jgi:hypothetical protein
MIFEHYDRWIEADIVSLIDEAQETGEALLLEFNFCPNEKQFGTVSQTCFEAFYTQHQRYALVFSSPNAREVVLCGGECVFSNRLDAEAYLA